MRAPDLDLLREGALAAGEIAMKFFGKKPEVWDKGGSAGPVTEADLAIDKMLTDLYRTARPDYGWLSEETDDDPTRLNHDDVFIVDPIDGTRAFIDHHANFATSVAIAHKGVVQAAVVHLPAKDMTYEAALGQGAFLNGEPITHSGRLELNCARILASGPQMRSEHWRNGPPPVERHFRSSLAYRLSLVAQGRFDGMLTLRDTWEWDVAAGDLICQEAGVNVSMSDGKDPRYNQKRPFLNGMVAATPKIHQGLMGYL